jgi:dephospho-CoA kinase
MQAPGIAIGITGGIACGKSTVGGILEAAGLQVLDTDRVAHALMVAGSEVHLQVVEVFGEEILDAGGEVDRKKLGAIVFREPDRLAELNRIVHPAVSQVWRRWLAERIGVGEDVAVMIPLLFEVGADEGWDAILVVVSPEDQVLVRLAARGLSEAEARSRIASQMPPDEKMKRTNFVIENDGSMIDLERNTLRIWQAIQRERRVHS